MSKMEQILINNGMRELIQFEKECISPNIVNKLSLYEMYCLGLTDRSAVMALRTECVKYGNERPDVLNQEGSPPMFVIPKETLETLIETGFTVAKIAALLCVSQSIIYRRMRQYGMSTVNFTDINDEALKEALSQVISGFPDFGEEMIRQLLCQKNIKALNNISSFRLDNLNSNKQQVLFSQLIVLSLLLITKQIPPTANISLISRIYDYISTFSLYF